MATVILLTYSFLRELLSARTSLTNTKRHLLDLTASVVIKQLLHAFLHPIEVFNIGFRMIAIALFHLIEAFFFLSISFIH